MSDGKKSRGARRREIGVVLSAKMDKTIVVEVARLSKHPKYEKYVKKRVRFHAHDEENTAKTGDRVEIAETRPLSKSKRWRLLRIFEHQEV